MLKQLYVPPRRQPKDRVRRATGAAKRWVRRRSLHIAASVIIVVAWVGVHLHYYNYLKSLEFNVQVAEAQIAVQQTRRFRIQKNLTRLVSQFSMYEDKLLTTLTAMRAANEDGLPLAVRSRGLHGASDPNAVAMDGAPLTSGGGNVCMGPVDGAAGTSAPALASAAPSPPPLVPTAPAGLPNAVKPDVLDKLDPKTKPELRELLSRLRVVAEQYPELQLSESIQHLATTIVDTETEIANRIMAYNEAVNNYVTVTDTFPGYIFAKLSGFPPYEFYPIDKSQREYNEVSF
jgi:hypothetical protein